MPRFAANLSMMYTEFEFLDRFEAAAADGFEAVEFLSPYSYESEQLADKLRQHGLQQVLFNSPPGGVDAASIEQTWQTSARGTACIPGREEEFRAGLLLALQYARQLPCPRIHVMAGLKPEAVAHEQALATYVSNLKWACAQAVGMPLELLIEPINTRDMPGFFLNRQAQAHELLAAVGSPQLKVQMDLYHCQIVEGDLAMRVRLYLPTGQVSHIQIAGVPQRHEPDVGEVNYPFLFELLDELGYAGWVGCEYRPKSGTRAGLGWLKGR